MTDDDAIPRGGYILEPDTQRREVLSRVLAEHNVIAAQRVRRVELLRKLEAYAQGESNCLGCQE